MGQAKRLLIVEDSEDIRVLLAEVLEEEGYAVEVASDGREAIEVLERAAELPNLILLDLMMPVMDGFEFREAQRRTPRIAEVPILLMTAATDPEQKAKSLGAVGCLKKPFTDIDKIMATIARFT